MLTYFYIAAQALIGGKMLDVKIVKNVKKITIVIVYKKIIKGRDFFIFQV